jgi:hypothetical protein
MRQTEIASKILEGDFSLTFTEFSSTDFERFIVNGMVRRLCSTVAGV